MLDSLLSRPDSADTTDQDRPNIEVDPGSESDSGSESDLGSESGTRPAGTDGPIDDEDPDAAESGLPLDITFEILKNRRRRLILKYLEDEPDSTPIGELAEHIAAIENDIDPRQLDSQQRKRVYIGLYQCHLPKMDDAGVIEYNQTRGIVDLNDSAAPLYEYLDPQEEEPEGGGGRRYLLFTSLFAVAFLVTRLSSIPSMTDVLVLGFCLGMLSLAVLDGQMSPDSQ
jgi:DNA-binding transcriptional ArsR family regulator